MRLELVQAGCKAQAALLSAVGWYTSNDLYTCSDDQSLQKWNTRGENQGKVCVLDTSFTDLHCFPLANKKQQNTSNDVFAVACTDGTLRFVRTNGSPEKSVEAHRGAVLCARWSLDGSSIATSGEDGQVKVWSRAGMLRSTVVQADEPVHCVAWGGADGARLLHCSGCYVTIRVLQSLGTANANSNSQISWKAHDALVLAADWNATTNLIVTGGEDCRYKVWDPFGRLLYSSSLFESSITSVAWSPDGALFAAGSFGCLTLCDVQGWSYCQVRPASGSLLGICWSPDGTGLAASGGNGCLVLAVLLGRRVEDGHIAAELVTEKVISIADLFSEATERLEFRESVLKMKLGFGHLVVCTASQCHIYSTSNFNTPHIYDLKDPVQLILLCARGFAMLDTSGGVQVYTYEGHQLCVIKPAGMHLNILSQHMISLSSDTLAVAAGSTVSCFDTAQGRSTGEGVVHTTDIRAVTLSQFGTASDRLLALVDSNGDLYITKVLISSNRVNSKAASAAAAGQQILKLATNVCGSAVWHNSAPMLAAMVDGQLAVWYHPGAAFVDRDLLGATKCLHTDGSWGPGASLDMLTDSTVLLRRADGARVFASIAPQPMLLHELARQGQWDKALRLARVSNDSALWACLAALAVSVGELSTAEAAFAAVDMSDKLQYILHLRTLAGGAGTSGGVVLAAELALYKGQTEQAETMLIQAGLLYRAIKLYVKMHSWQRALNLARKHKQHVDTVLMYRRRYLSTVGQQEVLPDFKALESQTVDEAAVKEHIRQEKAQEAQLRASAAATVQPGKSTAAQHAAGGGMQAKARHRE